MRIRTCFSVVLALAIAVQCARSFASDPPPNADAETQTQPSDNASSSEKKSEKALPPSAPPEGTLGPITLKSTLEKSKILLITLEEALKLAEGQSIAIDAAEENVELQGLDYRYRLSDLLPDVVAEYRQSRFVGAVQIFGGETLGIYRTTYQPMLTANYTIYTAGKNILEIRASKQREEAQRNQLEDVRQETLRQVAEAYYDLQQAYWQRAIALQAIKEAELNLAFQQARLSSGIGIKLDVLQAETLLGGRKQDLLQAENRISQISQRLSNLLNMDFEVDIGPSALESTVTKFIQDEMPTSQLIALAKAQYPRLQTLRKLAEASKTDVRVAISDLFPKIDITGYISSTGPQIDTLKPSRSIGLQASTNLLENLGFGKPLKIKEAKSIARLSELAIAEAERTLEENVSNTLVDLKTLQNRIELAKENLTYAKAAYENAWGRMKAGVGTIVDLENTMNRLNQARSDLAIAFLEYNKAQVNLLAYLGVISIETLTQGYKPNVARTTHP